MRKKVIQKENSVKIKTLEPHFWRLCLYGEHWVTTHPMNVPPTGEM